MRHVLSAKLLPLTIASLVGVHAAPALAKESPLEVTITIADGSNCAVDNTTVLCPDVLKYLREVLKLPAGSRVHLIAEKNSTYESTVKLVELLEKSEYKLPVMYMNGSDSPED